MTSSIEQRVDSAISHGAKHVGWAMLLRGLVAIAFGIVALRSPGIAAGALVVVFAVYAFADAVLDFTLASQLGRAGERWGWYLLAGLVSVTLGVVALAYPGVSLLTAVFVIAVYSIIHGILGIATAFSWEGADSRWLLGLAGVLGVLLGLLLLGSPVAGGVALLWTIGVFAICWGAALLVFGVRVLNAERRVSRSLEDRPEHHAAAH